MILLLSACSKNESPKPAPTDTTVRTDAIPSAPATPTKTVGVVEKLEFDRSTVPGECNYVGKILDGARWRDNNGENILLLSQRERSTENGSAVEFYGYCYVKQGDSTRLLWKIQDNAENWCDKGEGLVSDIRVHDVDNDGVAENAFVYSIWGNCDVSPVQYKLLMHSDAAKYAIRGDSRVDVGGGEKMGGKKTLDFNDAPPAYREWASELWDKSVR